LPPVVCPLSACPRLRMAVALFLRWPRGSLVSGSGDLRHEATAGRPQLLPAHGGQAAGNRRPQDSDITQLLLGSRLLEDLEQGNVQSRKGDRRPEELLSRPLQQDLRQPATGGRW